jgi:hypothetical protein
MANNNHFMEEFDETEMALPPKRCNVRQLPGTTQWHNLST